MALLAMLLFNKKCRLNYMFQAFTLNSVYDFHLTVKIRHKVNLNPGKNM